MDMDMGSAVDPTVADLPITDIRCLLAHEACNAFYAAENVSQAATPFAGQFVYGRWLTYYYVCLIAVAALVHWGGRWYNQNNSKTDSDGKPSRSTAHRVLALTRFWAYRNSSSRRVRILSIPSWGMSATILSTIIIVTVFTFAEMPYYREHLGYGSPPIAIRTGLMATACTPILVALSTKVNVVSWLTGLGHEKLNVVHRWVGWIAFALSLVHTIPFFIASASNPGDSVTAEFYVDNPPDEFTGVPALGMLFGLCLLSLPPIRRWAHETFYYVHVLLAISYLGLLFWHSADTLDSWAYLWATLALWLASWFARLFWKTQPLSLTSRWLEGSPAVIKSLPGGMMRIEVLSPPGFECRPGQHVYLRNPTLAPLNNHPFTPVGAFKPGSKDIADLNQKDGSQNLVFLVRKYSGFTAKMSDFVSSQPDADLRLWLDGPYGGITRRVEKDSDSVILFAGGSGITACSAWFLYVLKANQSGVAPYLKRIDLVWVVKSREHLKWMSDIFEAALSQAQGVIVNMHFYVTGSSENVASSQKTDSVSESIEKQVVKTVVDSSGESDIEEIISPSLKSFEKSIYSGRPNIPVLLQELVPGSRRVAVIGCGPHSMKIDLANSVANVQRLTWTDGVESITLDIESFDL